MECLNSYLGLGAHNRSTGALRGSHASSSSISAVATSTTAATTPSGVPRVGSFEVLSALGYAPSMDATTTTTPATTAASKAAAVAAAAAAAASQ